MAPAWVSIRGVREAAVRSRVAGGLKGAGAALAAVALFGALLGGTARRPLVGGGEGPWRLRSAAAGGFAMLFYWGWLAAPVGALIGAAWAGTRTRPPDP